MRWGHRKSQARSYQKQLNKLDKESTDQIAKYMKADVKTKQYGGKGVRYIRKHDTNPSQKDSAKLRKITNKMNKYAAKRDAAKKAMEYADSKIFKIMAEATQNNYKIKTKQVIRNGEIGRTYVTTALSGPLGSIAINSVRAHDYVGNYQTINKRTGRIIDQVPWGVSGNKYKVRDNQ